MATQKPFLIKQEFFGCPKKNMSRHQISELWYIYIYHWNFWFQNNTNNLVFFPIYFVHETKYTSRNQETISISKYLSLIHLIIYLIPSKVFKHFCSKSPRITNFASRWSSGSNGSNRRWPWMAKNRHTGIRVYAHQYSCDGYSQYIGKYFHDFQCISIFSKNKTYNYIIHSGSERGSTNHLRTTVRAPCRWYISMPRIRTPCYAPKQGCLDGPRQTY